ncbi:LOW QUALITY PROTEIN: Hypothetical protein PHPALM_6315 [Phytophthora palmivora]|uniref:Reverse transcriptase domain-containing protein n=1 Tax=Phytophthora palmivora TaxID=4796 RepID=A0A2P4YF46_9STRA|nr:LOW QUALITY PROTEIN: Hypothetical protein PHPALM_6315 [Phytophthora palmivora]
MSENLHRDFSESDGHECFIQYFKACHENIDDHGWRIFFTGDDGWKQLCSVMIKSLEPKALREEFDRTVCFQTRKAREDEVVLHDLILEKGLDHEKAYQSSLPKQKSSGDRPKIPSTPYPRCGDLQWLSECSRATDIEKADILNNLRAQRGDGGRGEVARLKHLRECIPSDKKTVTLNDELNVCHIGADRTAISKKHMDELLLCDSSIRLTRLPTPVLIVIIADHALSLCVYESCCALLVVVSRFIIDQGEPEFILGLDHYTSIGIIAEHYVEEDVLHPTEIHLPTDKVQRLRDITFKHEIWRIKLGNDPPARVKPFKIRFKDGAKAQCKILTGVQPKIGRSRLCYDNPTSRWARSVLPVCKSGTTAEDYRQTRDYRLVNDLIDALIRTMPHMSSLLERTKGKRGFGLFDLLKGFLQFPIDKVSQELMSYITDSKIYTSRRNCLEALLYHYLVIWIDDILLFAEDIDTYLTKLEEFFDLVESLRLNLSALKNSLYQQKVNWCGCMICKDGITHDPVRFDTHMSMPYPTTAGQLQLFLCATNRIRNSMVDYDCAIHSLQQRIDLATKQSKRTKCVAAGISIQACQLEERFVTVSKISLHHQLPDYTSTTCVFSDASDMGLITQNIIEDVDGLQWLARRVVAVGWSANLHCQVEKADTEERQ